MSMITTQKPPLLSCSLPYLNSPLFINKAVPTAYQTADKLFNAYYISLI